MIALALMLAAAQPAPSLACTHERTGQIAQARLRRGRIALRLGGRWHLLPHRQAIWSCMPADARRYRIDLD